jgi:hypothetical protein
MFRCPWISTRIVLPSWTRFTWPYSGVDCEGRQVSGKMVGKGVVVGLEVGLKDKVGDNTGVPLGDWLVSDGVSLRANTSVWVDADDGLGKAITAVGVAAGR